MIGVVIFQQPNIILTASQKHAIPYYNSYEEDNARHQKAFQREGGLIATVLPGCKPPKAFAGNSLRSRSVEMLLH